MKLRPRRCPVCGSSDSLLVAEANLDPAKLNAYTFASRKSPELMHHRLVLCGSCDALYANPGPGPSSLAVAYAEAAFDSGQEARYAARTYASELARIPLPDKRGALDIGTGDGAFLEELLAAGFSGVEGVEPSTAPWRAAKPAIRRRIHHGMFTPSRYKAGSFSLITCFQTLEHVEAPGKLLQSVHRLLKPGGAFFTVSHSHRALSAKILGMRSPIYDIEHLQLLSPRSLTRLLELNGFGQVRVETVTNHYPLHYWLKILPIPGGLKAGLGGVLKSLGLADVALPMPAGNLLGVGIKG